MVAHEKMHQLRCCIVCTGVITQPSLTSEVSSSGEMMNASSARCVRAALAALSEALLHQLLQLALLPAAAFPVTAVAAVLGLADAGMRVHARPAAPWLLLA